MTARANAGRPAAVRVPPKRAALPPGAFEPTLWRGQARVVHCATRESLWLPYVEGKKDRDGRPRGYRVEFAPGDGRDFDADGRAWHEYPAAMRQWSMVPKGVSAEERASCERARLGLVPDIDAAAEAVKADEARAEAPVEVKNAKGEIKLKKKTRARLGLPKAPKAAAQVALFAVPPDPRAIERKRLERAARRSRAGAR
jgi:hypothetical protein